MRSTLSFALYSLGFFLLSEVRAREPTQHSISPRSSSLILDTCAYLETPLSEVLSAVPALSPFVATTKDGLVEACLCTSAIRSFFDSLDLDGVDVDELERAAEAYIVESSGAQHCTYPPHATQRCSHDNPCGFECMDGFQFALFEVQGKEAATCTCPQPNTVCDGQCGSFPDGCPSKTVPPKQGFRPYRDPSFARPSPSLEPSPQPNGAFHSNPPVATGSFSYAQAQQAQESGCAPRETLCGAYAPRGRRTTECIDTQKALESCGGCMVPPPLPFFSYDSNDSNAKRDTVMGVDCSALEGVVDVSCYGGACLVQACEEGWMVAPSGDHCLPETFSSDAKHDEPDEPGSGVFNENYVPAHMPLLQPSGSSTTISTGGETSTAVTSDTDSENSSQVAPSVSPSSEPNDPSSASGRPSQFTGASQEPDSPNDNSSPAAPGDNDGSNPDIDRAPTNPSPDADAGTAGDSGDGSSPDDSLGEGNFGGFAAGHPDESDDNSRCTNGVTAPGIDVCLNETVDVGMGADTGPAGVVPTNTPDMPALDGLDSLPDVGADAAGIDSIPTVPLPDVNAGGDLDDVSGSVESSVGRLGQFAAGAPDLDNDDLACGGDLAAFGVSICLGEDVGAGTGADSGLDTPTIPGVPALGTIPADAPDVNVPSVFDAVDATDSDLEGVTDAGTDAGAGTDVLNSTIPGSDPDASISLGVPEPGTIPTNSPDVNVPSISDIQDATDSDLQDATNAETDAGAGTDVLNPLDLSGFNASPPFTDPDALDGEDIDIPTVPESGSPGLPTDSLLGQLGAAPEGDISVVTGQNDVDTPDVPVPATPSATVSPDSVTTPATEAINTAAAETSSVTPDAGSNISADINAVENAAMIGPL